MITHCITKDFYNALVSAYKDRNKDMTILRDNIPYRIIMQYAPHLSINDTSLAVVKLKRLKVIE